jgi:hypothetical protein
MYSLVQEMGRVDRIPVGDAADGGDNRYEVHLSFSCLISLFIRIMQHPNSLERRTQLGMMHDVLELLITPKTCQHTLMERYFARPGMATECITCQSMCNFCSRGSAVGIAGAVYRHRLCQVLLTFCTRNGQLTTAGLIKCIKLNKGDIFHKQDIPRSMGPVHALCLQLTATRILELQVSSEKKHLIGKRGIMPINVIVSAPTTTNQGYWRTGTGSVSQ